MTSRLRTLAAARSRVAWSSRRSSGASRAPLAAGVESRAPVASRVGAGVTSRIDCPAPSAATARPGLVTSTRPRSTSTRPSARVAFHRTRNRVPTTRTRCGPATTTTSARSRCTTSKNALPSSSASVVRAGSFARLRSREPGASSKRTVASPVEPRSVEVDSTLAPATSESTWTDCRVVWTRPVASRAAAASARPNWRPCERAGGAGRFSTNNRRRTSSTLEPRASSARSWALAISLPTSCIDVLMAPVPPRRKRVRPRRGRDACD